MALLVSNNQITEKAKNTPAENGGEKMKLTDDEKHVLKDVLKIQIMADRDMVEKDPHAFSYFDGLRFIDGIKNMKQILKKLKNKKAPRARK